MTRERANFKKGDRVFAVGMGWGTVELDNDTVPYKTKAASGSDKPIFVNYDGPHHGNYTASGKAFTKGKRVLFFEEVVADESALVTEEEYDDKNCFYSDGGDHYRGYLVDSFHQFAKPFLADDGKMYQFMDITD